MKDMSIRLIPENKKDFLPLLLLGDEQESHIDKYLEHGELFALYDGDLKSVCVVTDEGGGILEIQNIATDERYQRQGYASRLIDYVAGYYTGKYNKIILGTGDVPGIRFYDPDGHIIEVGEKIDAVVRRFLADGMNASEIAVRMDVQEKYVLEWIQEIGEF